MQKLPDTPESFGFEENLKKNPLSQRAFIEFCFLYLQELHPYEDYEKSELPKYELNRMFESQNFFIAMRHWGEKHGFIKIDLPDYKVVK